MLIICTRGIITQLQDIMHHQQSQGKPMMQQLSSANQQPLGSLKEDDSSLEGEPLQFNSRPYPHRCDESKSDHRGRQGKVPQRGTVLSLSHRLDSGDAQEYSQALRRSAWNTERRPEHSGWRPEQPSPDSEESELAKPTSLHTSTVDF